MQEKPTSIRNFRQVHNWLYRGGQPNEEGFDQLLALGVKTVISLRWNRTAIAKERSLTKAKGLNFVSIPLSYLILPSKQDIAQFFSVLDDEAMRPVFVHCLLGSDRTGMLLAMYRIARDNWGVDKAYEEMKEGGFHKIRIRQFKWAVYGFARRLEREQQEKTLNASR